MRLAILAGLLLLASPGLASAEGRPSSKTMSCASARAMVEKQGATIFTTGPANFDRFVASRAFCTVSETLEPAFVPAMDNTQCFIGYRCREIMGQDRK
jgi:hypothetical protein